MKRMIFCLVLAVCLMTASPAEATDRFFQDQHVTSKHNVMRLDATSPDNAGVRPKPFARNFTYTLTRVSDGMELWSRKQGENEASPIRAFVHDAGWVVVWNSWHQLMVLNKDNGDVIAIASILDQFPKAESREYVHQTSAGPMWSASSHWRFATLQSQTVFVITTGWGRHVVMDVAKGKYIRITPKAEKELRISDLAAATEVLRIAVEHREALCKSGVGEMSPPKTPVSASEVSSALATLLRAEPESSVQALRQLEQCVYVGSSGGMADFGGKYEDGINPFMYREFTLRRIAQMGLRRIGEKPVELSGSQIINAERIGVDLPSPRAQRVDLVRQGMNTREIVEAIGHPDVVRTIAGTWEYDIDDDEPFTLLIYFDEAYQKVDRVERLAPKWKEQQRWNDVFALN